MAGPERLLKEMFNIRVTGTGFLSTSVQDRSVYPGYPDLHQRSNRMPCANGRELL